MSGSVMYAAARAVEQGSNDPRLLIMGISGGLIASTSLLVFKKGMEVAAGLTGAKPKQSIEK
jgi:hypothetical protein